MPMSKVGYLSFKTIHCVRNWPSTIVWTPSTAPIAALSSFGPCLTPVLRFDPGFDLVSADDVDAVYLKRKLKMLEEPLELMTANGPIVADKKVALRLRELKGNVNPLVIDDSPPVLSLGRRCMDEGYSFIWPAWSDSPQLVMPNKRGAIQLKVHNYVP